MRRSGVGIGPGRTVREPPRSWSRRGGVRAVIDGTRLVGIVTDRDLVRRALAPGLAPDARVDSVMTTPVTTIDGRRAICTMPSPSSAPTACAAWQWCETGGSSG